MIKSIIILTTMIAASKLLEDSGVRLNGSAIGIPYDFRVPTLQRIKERIWNSNDSRIFTPMAYGAGWTINIPSLFRALKGHTR